MTPTREELIENLADDLRPTRGPRPVEAWIALWWVVSWVLVYTATVVEAPLREGWRMQLLTHPRFLAEMLLGAVAGAAAIGGAFRLAVPGPGRPAARLALPLLLLGLWVVAYLVRLAWPALEPSMAGKREGCWIRVLLYATPPLLLGLALLRRFAPLDRAATGAIAGAAAGAIPGLLMQVACLYDPTHILLAHLAPVAAMAALGAALGALFLRRI